MGTTPLPRTTTIPLRPSFVLFLLGALTGPALAAPLTTDGGAPVGDNQNSQTAGPDGDVLLQHLLANFAGDLGQVKDPTVKARIVGYLLQADATYGERVAKAVGVKVEDAKKASAELLVTK